MKQSGHVRVPAIRLLPRSACDRVPPATSSVRCHRSTTKHPIDHARTKSRSFPVTKPISLFDLDQQPVSPFPIT